MTLPARERMLLFFIVLVILGSMVAFARNPIAAIHASMYAEDGLWTSLIYRTGGLAGYLRGNEDYLVVGNMMLAHLAVIINHVIFGAETISRLPEVIAVVSYVFFAAVAALPVVALKAYLSLPARLLLWALLLLLPVGPSADEIFGRIVNTGFAFAFIGAMIILWRETFRPLPFCAKVLALDALLLVCCATNPIAIGITGGYLAFRIGAFLTFRFVNLRGRYINDCLLAAGLLPIAIVNAIGIITVPASIGEGPLTLAGFVYTGVARPLLYPLIFPWYAHLTHVATLILSALLIALFWAGWRLTPHKAAFGFLFFCLAVMTLAVAVQRPGFAVHMADYASSFPDRYYHTQNFFVLTAVVWTADAFVHSLGTRLKAAGTAMAVALLLIYAFHPKHVFDFYGPRQMAPIKPTFEEQLRQGRTLEHNPEFMEVDIFPSGWSAIYPVWVKPEPEALPQLSTR